MGEGDRSKCVALTHAEGRGLIRSVLQDVGRRGLNVKGREKWR